MKLLSDQFTAKLKWLSPYFLNRTFLPELSNPRFLKKPFLFVTLKLTKGCYNSKAWPKANPKKNTEDFVKEMRIISTVVQRTKYEETISVKSRVST